MVTGHPPWRLAPRTFEGARLAEVPLTVMTEARVKALAQGVSTKASVNKVVEIRPSVWQVYCLTPDAQHYDRLSREAHEESVFMRDKGNRELARLRETDSQNLRQMAEDHTTVVTVTA